MFSRKKIILYHIAAAVTVIITLFSINQRQNLIRELSQYDDVKYDFIVSKPSNDQIDVMNSKSFIEKAVPFYSINENILVDGKLTEFRVLILDNFENIEYTSFNSERQEISFEFKEPHNQALIDYYVYESDTLELNSIKTINFGLDLDVSFVSVYRYDNSNTLNKGTIVIQNNNNIAEFIESRNLVYAGAFITSIDSNEAKEYLRSYKPLGELEQKQNISEEAYKEYLKYFQQQDHSKEVILIDSLNESLFQSSVFSNLLVLLVLLLLLVGLPSILYFSNNYKIIMMNLEKGSLSSLIKKQSKYIYQVIATNIVLVITLSTIYLFLNAYQEVKIYSILIGYFAFLVSTFVFMANYIISIVYLGLQKKSSSSYK
jgi:hypothetical protein